MILVNFISVSWLMINVTFGELCVAVSQTCALLQLDNVVQVHVAELLIVYWVHKLRKWPNLLRGCQLYTDKRCMSKTLFLKVVLKHPTSISTILNESSKKTDLFWQHVNRIKSSNPKYNEDRTSNANDKSLKILE